MANESPATLLIVSHDRRLLDTICARLWVVEPAGRGEPARAVAFEGGYAEWRRAIGEGWTVEGALELQGRRYDPDAVRHAARGAVPVVPTAAAGESRTAAPARRSARSAALSKDAYRRQKALVEGDLNRLGLRRSHLELALGDPGTQANFVELRRVTSELADVDAALAQAEEAWLTIEERAPR